MNDNTNDLIDDKTVPSHSVPHVSSGTYGQGDPLLRSGMLMPPLAPGTLGTIGKYQVVRILGEGGMGQVLLAREPVTVSLVAIKLIKPEFLNKGWAVHRFLTEARHMFKMSHPAIIRVLDVSDRAEGPYFVMPYMSGGSLAEKIKPGEPLEQGTILPIARAVAEALHHAHSHGITHRDLKPSNILLDGDGRAHLADFGLLRTFHNDTIIDAGQPQIEGTVPYMSPAVAAGKAEDTRCDIYSFGCLLYEMLTGQPPYQGPTVDAILKQIQDGPPPSIRQLNPQAPAALVAIADHAMARELRDRYATMGDVVKDLECAGQGKEQSHRRETVSPNKRKALVTAGIVALIGLVAFGVSQLPIWTSSGNIGRTSTPNTTRAAPAGKTAPGTVKVIDLGGGVTMEFVLIHPGSFMMGSDEGSSAIEGVPVHKVTLTKPFYLGKYEVTQEQWEKIMGANPSYFQGPKNPVDSVTWNDCQSFVAKLNAKVPGRTFRLPTEAEWEYACRAGSTGAYCFREGEGSLAEYAWYGSAANNTTHPVGGKKPNAWGLYDMHGNVLEWCADWYADYPASAVTDPQGPISGSRRVHRGSCNKSTFRGWDRQEFIENTHGLRLALDAVPGDNLLSTTPLIEVPFSYTVKDGAVTITKYTGPGGEVKIPDKINGLPVTIIGRRAFQDCHGMTSLIIPNSVTLIEGFAFLHCYGLTNVTIPNSVTDIGGYAFGECTALNKVTIPNSVISMGANPFNSCDRLISITVDAANPAYSSVDRVLFSKDKTCLVACPAGMTGNYVIPDSVNRVVASAFLGCGALTKVTIPESVTVLERNAFADCGNLTEVYCKGIAPNGTADASLFSGANKATIYYLPTTTGWGKEFGGRPTAVWNKPEVEAVEGPFSYTVKDGAVTIVKYTGPGGDVVIPDKINGLPVTTIGSGAFSGCAKLTGVTIPATVTSIAKESFSGCTSLVGVYFKGNAPGGGTDASVFTGDDNANVYYLPGTKGWAETFVGRPALLQVKDYNCKIEKGAVTITRYTGPGGDVTIPDKINGQPVTTIGDQAFRITPVTSVTIPDSVTSIGNWAFHACVGLIKVTIGNSVASIKYDAFAGCSGLTRVALPASVTTITANPWASCGSVASITVDPANPAYFSAEDGVVFDKKMTRIVSYPGGKAGGYAIPNSVTIIGDAAFAGCSGLTKIMIPDSVSSIENYAFVGCSGLTDITIPNSVTGIGCRVFLGCTELVNIALSNRITGIWMEAFAGCTKLAAVTIPASVTAIGTAPFRGCSALNSIAVDPANPAFSSESGVVFNKEKTSLRLFPEGKVGNYVIPKNVTDIADLAFMGCTLSGVTISAGITSIGNPFGSCRELTSILVDQTNPAYISMDGVLLNKEKTSIVRYPVGKAGNYVIPDSVAKISESAFEGCTSLTDVTISESVTSVETNAFGGCCNLTGIYFRGNPPRLGNDILKGVNDKATVYHLPTTTGWGKDFGGRPTAVWEEKAK